MKNLTTAGRGLCHDQALCKFSMVDMKFVDVLHLRILAWLWNWGSGSTEQLLFCPSKLRKKFNLIWLIESLQEDFWIIFSLIFFTGIIANSLQFCKVDTYTWKQGSLSWSWDPQATFSYGGYRGHPRAFLCFNKELIFYVFCAQCSSICMYYTKTET